MAIFGKLSNLGSLKCDPYVKHWFLWLFIELQHKLCKRYITKRQIRKKGAGKNGMFLDRK